MSFLTLNVRSLVTDGLLTEDGLFIGSNARDMTGKPIEENQLLRLYGGVVLRELSATLIELRQENLELNEALASNIAGAMEAQWERHDRFPGDVERLPQPYIEGSVPIVVRNSMVREYLGYRTVNDMQHLVDIFEGVVLREQLAARCVDVTEEQFARQLRVEQRQPVVVRWCQNSACKNKVVTRVDQAVAAIRRFGLMPVKGQPFSGKFFNPHAKCLNCNRDRSWMKSDGHPKHASASPPATLGSVADAILAQRQRDAQRIRPGKEKKTTQRATTKKDPKTPKKVTKKLKKAPPELVTVHLGEPSS